MQQKPVLAYLSKRVRKLVKRPDAVDLGVPQEPSSSEASAEDTDDAGEAASEAESEAEAEQAGSSDSDGDASPSAKATSASSSAAASSSSSSAAATTKEGEPDKVVEDGFFSLADMEAFLQRGEAGQDEDVDVFRGAAEQTGGEEEEEEEESAIGALGNDDPYSGPKYSDMFGAGAGRQRRRSLSAGSASKRSVGEGEGEGEGGAGSDSDDSVIDRATGAGFGAEAAAGEGSDEEEGSGDEEEALSSHQRKQRKLAARITELEAEALGPKKWELTGEVTSRARPQNSLLEAVLEHERVSKPAPEITVEVTAALEDIIKQRILDEAWDDVERKAPPEGEGDAHELAEVSQEKSKKGLGELYEEEYMEKAMGVVKESAEDKLKTEIRGLFKTLCGKLDALSNFHFTPKPVVPEMAVQPDAPAIQLEEVIPAAVSEAQLRAPEEVYEKKRGRLGLVRAEEELSKEDRRRRRAATKAAKSKRKRQREAQRKLVARINPGMGNKYAKEQLMDEISRSRNITSGSQASGGLERYDKSAKFFAKLQDEAQTEIRSKKAQKRAVGDSAGTSSASFKL